MKRLVLVTAAILATQFGVPVSSEHWVGTWATGVQLTEPRNLPPPPGLADTTLRQVVHISIGGKLVRVRFSNAFGAGPITFTSAHLALSSGESRIRPETDRALTFGGKPSVTIPPGAPAVSDPIRFEVAPRSDLAVTVHVNDPSQNVTGHPGARCTSYLQSGDAVSAEELPTASKTQHWYYLQGIDVLARNSTSAVAVLGDSITDGRNSITDGNGRWPDYLARRLLADPKTSNVGVLNLGIGGNRVLNDGLGPSALVRLDRDVLSQPGVRWLIVLEGINDLGTAPRGQATTVAQDLIAAFQKIADQCHKRHIQVYGATIMPCGGSFYASPRLEADRQTINDWIRTSKKLDAVVDLDAVTRDPQNPSQLSASCDSGDHLHPADPGYRIIGGSIDLKLFTTSKRFD